VAFAVAIEDAPVERALVRAERLALAQARGRLLWIR
jgi:hypothetical protein